MKPHQFTAKLPLTEATYLNSLHLLFNPTKKPLPTRFPFRTGFSLQPLFEDLRRMAREDHDTHGAMASAVEALLLQAPALAQTIEDYDLLRYHQETLEALLKHMLGHQAWINEIRALVSPFGENFFTRTRRFTEALNMVDTEFVTQVLDSSTNYTRMLYAYKAILHKYYNYQMELDQPVVIVAPDKGGEYDRYYKVISPSNYMAVRNLAPIPELSRSEIDHLIQNIDDAELWMEYIPPENFEFVGFSLVHLTDVTNEIATATLKHILLTNDANVTEENFDFIEREIRTLLRKPHLQLGLASIQRNGELNVHSERKIWNSLRIHAAMQDHALGLEGTIYEEVMIEGRSIAIMDLHDLPSDVQFRNYLLEQGVRSILVAPLFYDGELVGLLELSSSQPGDLQALAALKLKQIESIFALAIHLNLQRFEDRVTAITQETYTAIHPTVAWRFREAAIALLDQPKHQRMTRAEPIVFPDLFPLYGSADIRSSSQHRNEAIRSDMLEHLELARTALGTAQDIAPLSPIAQLHQRVNEQIVQLSECWSTGDESAVADFVRYEINPLFSRLQQEHPGLVGPIERYFAHTMNDGGLLSRRRLSYETSLQQINDLLSEILEEEQAELQQIFPHYFEKHKTDGIEHTIYIGASMAPDHSFDPIYLRNLRLRQLIACCEIARRVEQLKPALEIPLDVAQLVLVQDEPLTIRFLPDEKRFDVVGAYSVGYEIVKKRIDKACRKGSDERITQPGKIAIIHSLEKVAVEYLRYIEYLRANGKLLDGIEELEVEDLPGVSGLRALRVRVNMEATVERRKSEEIMRVAEMVSVG
jgi:hypothetical protein